MAQIARALTGLRARQIAKGVYGTLPDGFLGLLARLGADPLPDPADYRLAFDLFNDPANKARAKLLRQVEGQIKPTKIRVVASLIRCCCASPFWIGCPMWSKRRR